MPHLAALPIAGAAVKGLFDLGGAVFQHKSASHAADAQLKASEDAIAYQKSRQAIDDQRYAQRWGAYQDAVNAWKQRNGYAVAPTPGGGSSLGVAPLGASLANLRAPAGPTGASAGPVAMAAPQDPSMGAPGGMGDAGQAPGGTLADLGSWTDWRRYGAGA